MEIERKFTIKELPADLESYPFHHIEQAYLNASPVVRVRKEDDEYYLTYNGSGLMAREEYNLPLDEASYRHLLKKADGNVISKKRYDDPGREQSAFEPGGILSSARQSRRPDHFQKTLSDSSAESGVPGEYRPALPAVRLLPDH